MTIKNLIKSFTEVQKDSASLRRGINIQKEVVQETGLLSFAGMVMETVLKGTEIVLRNLAVCKEMCSIISQQTLVRDIG